MGAARSCSLKGILTALLAFALASSAYAQRNLSVGAGAGTDESRVALVIGNASYQRAALKNPVNDARAIAQRLA